MRVHFSKEAIWLCHIFGDRKIKARHFTDASIYKRCMAILFSSESYLNETGIDNRPTVPDVYKDYDFVQETLKV